MNETMQSIREKHRRLARQEETAKTIVLSLTVAVVLLLAYQNFFEPTGGRGVMRTDAPICWSTGEIQ